MKKCLKCKITKQNDAFQSNRNREDGLQDYCKPCMSSYKKEYRKNNIEKISAQNKSQYQKNRSHILQNKKEYNITPIGKFNQYKHGAQRRNIEFNLSFDEFLTFWQQSCYYCGNEIETIGLDRINPNLSYHIQNIVSCCEMCNKMKRKYEESDFISQCIKIAAKFGVKYAV